MSKLKSYDVIVKTSTEWYGEIQAKSLRTAKRLAEDEFNEGNLRQFGEEVEAVIAFIPRKRAGSWCTFERRFRPLDGPDGAQYWPREELPKDIDFRLVWTILDCDGKLYVSPGFHFVNRIDYVLCEVPWTDEDLQQPDYRYD